MTGPVVVVGDLMTDVLVGVSGPLAPGSDTPAGINVAGGGSGANVAAWLGALGGSCSYLGRVGADAFGRIGVEELASYGVDVRVVVDPARATGTCVVLVGPDGERTMLPDRGANDALGPADLPEPLFRTGAHLHLSGYTLLGPGSRPAGLRALQLARTAGMTTSVDAASSAPLSAVGAPAFLGWIAGADLLLCNEDEARALGGPLALARRVRHLVLKRGPAGSEWHTGGSVVRRPAAGAAVGRPPDRPDSTGAGDGFAAGLLRAWRDGSDVGEALAAGNEVGAAAVGTRGARPPRRT